MEKIPTLFVRDFTKDNGRYVLLGDVTPGCEWVMDGEGVPTRKYDGTCVMVDPDGGVWARREVKAGKPIPALFWPIEKDDTTGKTVGWEPYDDSGFAKYIDEALDNAGGSIVAGTYELVGPKIQGNPEGYEEHTLIAHATADPFTYEEGPLSVDGSGGIINLMDVCREYGYEGVVWHHPDGRMAKLKVRDIPKEPQDG